MLLKGLLLLAALTQVTVASPRLEMRDGAVCGSGIYGELLPYLKQFPIAQAWCSAVYPVSCTSVPKKRAVYARATTASTTRSTITSATPTTKVKIGNDVTTTTTTRSTVKPGGAMTTSTYSTTSSTDLKASAWSKCQRQPGNVVSTMCSCLETAKPCKTTITTSTKTSSSTSTRTTSTTTKMTTTSTTTQSQSTSSSSSTTTTSLSTSSTISTSSTTATTSASISTTSTSSTTISSTSSSTTTTAPAAVTCAVRGSANSVAIYVQYNTDGIQAYPQPGDCQSICKSAGGQTFAFGDDGRCYSFGNSFQSLVSRNDKAHGLFYDINCPGLPVSATTTSTSSTLSTTTSSTITSSSSTTTSSSSITTTSSTSSTTSSAAGCTPTRVTAQTQYNDPFNVRCGYNYDPSLKSLLPGSGTQSTFMDCINACGSNTKCYAADFNTDNNYCRLFAENVGQAAGSNYQAAERPPQNLNLPTGDIQSTPGATFDYYQAKLWSYADGPGDVVFDSSVAGASPISSLQDCVEACAAIPDCYQFNYYAQNAPYCVGLRKGGYQLLANDNWIAGRYSSGTPARSG